MALVSGGSPRTVGAFYDVAFDRYLAPPAKTTGNGVAAGPCPPVSTTAKYPIRHHHRIRRRHRHRPDPAERRRAQRRRRHQLHRPARVVRDPVTCQPVMPWDFVRTNTIFGVIHAANGYTAWADKHPAYSSVAGHGSNGTSRRRLLLARDQLDRNSSATSPPR